jgi:hypothetical protein
MREQTLPNVLCGFYLNGREVWRIYLDAAPRLGEEIYFQVPDRDEADPLHLKPEWKELRAKLYKVTRVRHESNRYAAVRAIYSLQQQTVYLTIEEIPWSD